MTGASTRSAESGADGALVSDPMPVALRRHIATARSENEIYSVDASAEKQADRSSSNLTTCSDAPGSSRFFRKSLYWHRFLMFLQRIVDSCPDEKQRVAIGDSEQNRSGCSCAPMCRDAIFQTEYRLPSRLCCLSSRCEASEICYSLTSSLQPDSADCKTLHASLQDGWLVDEVQT